MTSRQIHVTPIFPFLSRSGWLIPLLLLVLLLPAFSAQAAPIHEPQPPVTPTPNPASLGLERVSGVELSPEGSFYNGPNQPDNDIRFRGYSSEEGLSQSSVTCILQDQQGFLWFGTQDGLNRFDGYTFRIFRQENPGELGHNTINSLLQTRDGSIWIATDGGGLDRYDPASQRFSHLRHDPANRNTPSSNVINALAEGQDGALWIGTASGLDRYDLRTGLFAHFQNDPQDSASLSNNEVLALALSPDRNLWVGTFSGLNRLDADGQHFTHFLPSAQVSGGLSSKTIQTLFFDRDGTLWVGTRGGGLNHLKSPESGFEIYRYQSDNPRALSSNTVTALAQGRDGRIWVGTNGGGLNILDPANGEFKHYRHDPQAAESLIGNVVLSIYTDRDGLIWSGSVGGVSLYDQRIKPFAHIVTNPNDANSLSSNNVTAFYADSEQRVWIGTLNGLNKLDPTTGIYTHYQASEQPFSLINNQVTRIIADRRGTLWIGTWGGGMDSFNPQTGLFDHHFHDPQTENGLIGNFVWTILEDHLGTLWVGTTQGLTRYDPMLGRYTHYQNNPNDPFSLSADSVLSILEDREGQLWIATDGGGLNRLNPSTGRFTRYQNDPNNRTSLSHERILCLHQDSQGILWIGTLGGGLNRFDPQGEMFLRLREQDGLPSDVVYGILEDNQGFLWLSTSKGIARYNPQTGQFKRFDQMDGVQSGEFNLGAVYRGPDGEMYFGGSDGYNTIQPAAVLSNPSIPPIVLTSLSQDNIPLPLPAAASSNPSVTLVWPNNDFEFEFAALSYLSPEKNQYAYWLEGYDHDWIQLGSKRSARYTNLPGGTYTLHLSGSNNDNIWNQNGLNLEIKVIPPFWQTRIFQFGGLLAFAGLILGVYQLRLRGIQRQARQLESQVEQRTAELRREIEQRMLVEEALRESETAQAVADERSRLARDLHDAVTQTLFSASLIAEALPQVWDKNPQRGADLLRELHQLSRGALAEMRTLLMELRPTALVEANLPDLLRQLTEAAAGKEGIPVELLVNGAGSLPSEVQIVVYRIAQESLNNIIKHARAKCVQVELNYTSDPLGLQLQVTDDGRGFQRDSVPAERLGLSIMRERAESIGARLNVSSQPGAGTQVRLEWQANKV